MSRLLSHCHLRGDITARPPPLPYTNKLNCQVHTWGRQTFILLPHLSLARTDWKLKAANCSYQFSRLSLGQLLSPYILGQLGAEHFWFKPFWKSQSKHFPDSPSLQKSFTLWVFFFLFLSPAHLPQNSGQSRSYAGVSVKKKIIWMWRLQLSEMSSQMQEHGTWGHKMFSYPSYFLLAGLGSPLFRKLSWCLIRSLSMYIIKETDFVLNNQEL